jgi:hypothetical protein
MDSAEPDQKQVHAGNAGSSAEYSATNHKSLDLKQFLAPVQSRQAGLAFATSSPIFCQPTRRKPVFNPKGF